MNRRFWDRFRQIAPDRGRVIAFLVLFASFEAFIRYLESLGVPIGNRLLLRPARALLLLSAATYGIGRVTSFHPAFQTAYRTWLENTPWNNRKPLPLGPVELVFQDGLVLGPLIFCSAILPQPRAMSLLAAFLIGHLGAIVVGLWLTRIRVVGYLSAFGLGLAVKLWLQPIECVAMAALVYLVAYEGLVQSLDRFPWTPRRLLKLNADISMTGQESQPCGWPHDRMLGEIVSATDLSRSDAVLGCALASWWAYVLASFIPNVRDRTGFLLVACMFPYYLFPLMRLVVYVQAHRSPISFWGRIRTLRWIIPGYDQVFVGPICAWIAGPTVLGLLHAAGCPLDACIVTGTGTTMAVALVAPPRLRRWRLTGQHRVVHGIAANNNVFVQAG